MSRFEDDEIGVRPLPPPHGDDRLSAARRQAADVIGKFWAAPSTAIRLGYGLTMHILGELAGARTRGSGCATMRCSSPAASIPAGP